MLSSDKPTLNTFFDLLSPNQYAVKSITVTYIASQIRGKWYIIAARIFIRNTRLETEPFYLQTENIIAGRFGFEDLQEDITEFISRCCDGKFKSDRQTFLILGRDDRRVEPNVYFDPFHAEGGQNRISVLALTGRPLADLRNSRDVVLELRAADTPFNNFEELVNELSLAGAVSDTPKVEFVTYQSAAIVPDVSRIENDVAHITVRLAKELDPRLFKLGVRQLGGGRTLRYSLSGLDFEWTDGEDFTEGRVSRPLEPQNVLQCFVNYNNVNYGYYWVIDPNLTPNVRYAALAGFDEKLSELKDWLIPEAPSRNHSRQFEIALGRFFWILGFSPMQLDSPNNSNDVPDLLLVDSKGRIVMVEATVDIINNKNKLDKLAARHRALRNSLESQGLDHVDSLPVIVTRLGKDAVDFDRDRAAELSIGILASEDIKTLLDAAHIPSDCSIVFDTLSASIDRAKQERMGSLQEHTIGK